MAEWLITSLEWLRKPLAAVDWLTVFGSFIGATAGAVAGAYSAFRLESHRRASESESMHAANGQRLLFDLYFMWNELAQYQKQVMSDLLNAKETEHWYLLKPSPKMLMSSEPLLDPNRYEFLLHTGAAELAADIALQRRRYDLVVSQIEQRSQIYIDSVRPRWDAVQLGVNSIPSSAEIIAVTGPHYYSLMSDMTENIKRLVPEDLASMLDCFRELRKQLQKRFPGHEFLNFRPD